MPKLSISTSMFLNNLSILTETYFRIDEKQVVFVRKQRLGYLFMILLFTLLLEYNLWSYFSFWNIPFGIILLIPLVVYLGYNKQLIIEKDTRKVYTNSYIYNKLFNSEKITILKEGEPLYAGESTDGDDNYWYTLYIRRKTQVDLFIFFELGTITLFKEELKKHFNIEVIFSPFDTKYN